jgi:hypothetical protein
MHKRTSFLKLVTDGEQLTLPLPPIPGIARSRTEYCPACQCVHVDKLADIRCQQAHLQHEQ